MQTVCVSSNWPTVESLHPRQLDIFVHGWQDDCPPPDVNGAAPAVTAPAVPGQGVGTIVAHFDALDGCYPDSFDLRDEFYVDWQAMRSLDATDYVPKGSASTFFRYSGDGFQVAWTCPR